MKNLLLISLVLLGGCSHSIHMVHTDGFDQPLPSSNDVIYIEAKAEQNVVLWLGFNTDYVEEAQKLLLDQCPGNIRAVSTQYSTSHGFLHWTNKILMKGVCVKS